MRPKKHETTGSGDLLRARLEQIINMKHELVLLAGKIEWQWIDSEIAPLYSDKGRPGIETRFVIGLLCSSTSTRLRQSYLRIAKRAAMMAGRYAHAKQFNRHRRELRMLRTRLGRIIRDIRRRIVGTAELEAVFAWPGLGKLAVDAVRNVDVPLILGTVLFTALVVVISNIVTDVVYAFVDPRIRYSE